MISMMNCMLNACTLKRALALVLALVLLSGFAAAEGQDAAMDALAGEDTQWQDPQWVDPGYVQPTINMDADIRLGYVASATGEINPFLCTERDLISLNQLVFESVVELDDEMRPVPLLADSWTSDGRKWTFKLREGVTFHNGAPLTSSEVVASYQRFLMSSELNPYYHRVQMIESIEIVDDLTFTVISKTPGYATLYAMTFPVVQSSTLNDRMARGTGPYWYTEYATGVGVRLEANPLWWKKDPEIHSIAAINFADAGDALEALRTNQVNMLCTQSPDAAVHRKFSDLTSMDYTTYTYEMLVPNLSEDSPMSDVRMRQAVMYAIDRAALAENAYLGMGIQCEVPMNPSSWLYNSQSAIYYYSPERALQLIQSCGWSDLTGDGMMNKVDGVVLKDLTLHLITYNEPTNNIRENAAYLIASYLEAVGINVDVEVRGKERALTKIRGGEYDLALVSVNLSEVPDLSPMVKSHGTLNLNSFRNDNMEVLLEQLGTCKTEEEFAAVYAQMQMIIVERLPVLGLLFRTGTVLSTRSLGGLSGLRSSNTMNGMEYMTKQ